MKYLLKFSFPMEIGNAALKDPQQFGAKMKQLLTDIKAEAAYFAPVDGLRGGYIILDIDDASQIPGIAEPLFFWLHAKIEMTPLMRLQDIEKAGPSMVAASKKWL
jgi:hypothetical protein